MQPPTRQIRRGTKLPSTSTLPGGPIRDFAEALLGELEAIRAEIEPIVSGDRPIEQYEVISRLNVVSDKVEIFKSRIEIQEGKPARILPMMRAGSFPLGGDGATSSSASTVITGTIVPVGWTLPNT